VDLKYYRVGSIWTSVASYSVPRLVVGISHIGAVCNRINLRQHRVESMKTNFALYFMGVPVEHYLVSDLVSRVTYSLLTYDFYVHYFSHKMKDRFATVITCAEPRRVF